MEQFSEQKTVLEAELEIVTNELRSIATHNEMTDDWIAVPEEGTVGNADENVASDAVEEWDTRRAVMAQLEIRYKNLKRALQKIEDGTYGTCEICGDPIEPERLAANPAARTNIAHKDEEHQLPV